MPLVRGLDVACVRCSTRLPDTRNGESYLCVDCMAYDPCRLCGKPIGFDRPFHGEGPTAVHSDCAEREYREGLRRAE